jgi:6-pyruvoyltetrahydropterin/6-carboxytetrahydropterin synthase
LWQKHLQLPGGFTTIRACIDAAKSRFMSRLTTLYIDKEAHKFSAAHFTIFSATERERLHGHNYSVSARIVAEMGDNGFSADYNVYKQRIAALCEPLDEYMLLAGESPHQTIEVVGGELWVTFDGRTLKFLPDETKILPVVNVTVEALAHLLLDELIGLSQDEAIVEVELGVSSGAGQTGSAIWRA